MSISSNTHPTMRRLFEISKLQPTRLARALGTSPQNITNWSARGISKGGAILASEKLGINPNYILKGVGSPIIEKSLTMNTTERINQRMKLLGIKQVEIVKATGASKGTVSQWINGGMAPSTKYASKLANCLKCDYDWLMFGKGKNPNDTEQCLDSQSTDTMQDEIAMRIIEERGRLGYSQQKLAEVTQIDINRLQSYEFGEDKIPIDFLTSIISSGIDIQYILTGQRLNSPDSSHTPQETNIISNASNIHSGIGVINQNKIKQLEQNKKH